VKVSDLDTKYMALAIRLAAKGRGFTSPNPMVGAVVVAKGRIVGQGHHPQLGGPHAEVVALRKAGRRARGATLYVSLEPCSHTNKRTPPCVPLIIASRVRRVVVAMQDPNPQVSGRGIASLRRAGLDVRVGCLREVAERLNEAYCHWMRTSRPLVTLKAGMTLDGKIATAAGESRWITGEVARRHAHHLRAEVDAVMVGIGTVLRDDPRLTARLPGRVHQPLRVIVDSRARISLTANVLSSALRGGTVIATTDRAPRRRVERLRALGTNVLVLPVREGQVSLSALLSQLGQLRVTSVLIEGGSTLNASALRHGVVNRVRLYIAPRLLGGQDAKGVFGGRAPKRLAEAVSLTEVEVRHIGEGLLLEGIVQPRGRRG
jgi:diaminohydroxyphosphoribosylaminopyrimidine deaminase/5-amino-6-(5-phosphoribosylamino)uracil reductase